jgi:hypothetical protein
VFRPGDIVISTPAKCGTTWLQMICALEIFKSAAFGRPLDQVSPWLDVLLRPLTAVLADLEAQAHRRFIKTHTPLDGLPFDDRVTYLCASRDPRDVAVSLDSHASNGATSSHHNSAEPAPGGAQIKPMPPGGQNSAAVDIFRGYDGSENKPS